MFGKLEQLGLQPIGTAFRPTPDPYIQQLEKDVGAALPPEYRAFLARYGVCSFADYVCFAAPGGPLVDISVFLGNDPDDSYDIGQTFRALSERSTTPILPFATDPLGNAVCLDLHVARFGQVCFWDHETENTAFVATSFLAFIAMLRRDS